MNALILNLHDYELKRRRMAYLGLLSEDCSCYKKLSPECGLATEV